LTFSHEFSRDKKMKWFGRTYRKRTSLTRQITDTRSEMTKTDVRDWKIRKYD